MSDAAAFGQTRLAGPDGQPLALTSDLLSSLNVPRRGVCTEDDPQGRLSPPEEPAGSRDGYLARPSEMMSAAGALDPIQDRLGKARKIIQDTRAALGSYSFGGLSESETVRNAYGTRAVATERDLAKQALQADEAAEDLRDGARKYASEDSDAGMQYLAMSDKYGPTLGPMFVLPTATDVASWSIPFPSTPSPAEHPG